MKKTIIALAAAAMLAACGQSTTTDPATGQQTSHDSGVSPLLAGALGYFMGRSMSPSPAPAPAVVPQTRTIIVNRTIQTPAPAVKTTPVVPPPAPRAIPAPTPAPKPSYSGPSSYRAPTTTFRSAPSGRR